METYVIDPKLSTVNRLPVFRGFEWETGACALFLRAPHEGIARLAFGFPRYSKNVHVLINTIAWMVEGPPDDEGILKHITEVI